MPGRYLRPRQDGHPGRPRARSLIHGDSIVFFSAQVYGADHVVIANRSQYESMGSSVSWAVFLGVFVGALIELVEVLAVVLVVGRVAGWRNAIAGAGSAVGLVAVAALVVGSGLALIPARPLELIAGLILLGFGQAWARSVTRYYGGVIRAPDRRRRAPSRTAGGGWCSEVVGMLWPWPRPSRVVSWRASRLP